LTHPYSLTLKRIICIVRYSNLFRFFFVCLDLLVLNVVYLILINSLHHIPQASEPKYVVLFIVANMLWLLSAYGTALYIEQGESHL